MRSAAPNRLHELPLVFKALSDPTRLRLLNLLAQGEVCVCFLGEVLHLAQPTVSRHLAYLKRAGLVTARREGRWTHYRWSTLPSSATCNVMQALRDSLSQDAQLQRDRERLKQVCC